MNWRKVFHKYKIPYIHGCIWDRHCQKWAPIPRISLLWGDHMWWVTLPGYWPGTFPVGEDRFEYRWGWHRLAFGHHGSAK